MNETALANRRAFVEYLERNPENKRQIFDGTMTDFENGRCALGLGCDALGIAIDGNHLAEPYADLAEALGYAQPFEYEDYEDRKNPASHYFEIMEYIWRLNDRDGLSFDAIAAKLRDIWNL